MPDKIELHDTENEGAVLGQALVREEARDIFISRTTPEDFGDPVHRKIAWSVHRCASEQLKPSNDALVMVAKKCRWGGDITVGYLRSLRREYGKPNPNFEAHIKKLKCDATKRYLVNEGAARLQALAFSPDAGVDQLAAGVKEISEAVERGRTSTELELVNAPGIVAAHNEVDTLRKSGKGFYSTGYSYLDAYLTEGMAPGKVSIWAGRTGMGKSALVSVNIPRNLTRKRIPVAEFALEMNTVSLVDRWLAAESRLPLDKIMKYRAKMSRKEEGMLTAAKKKLAENKYLYIDDRPRASLAYIRQQVRLLQQVRGYGHVIVVIDLFGKVEDLGDLRAQEYEKALGEVQIMARELGVHFALVVQIRRIEQGKDYWQHRPRLTEMRNSGALEDTADLVVLLYRAKYYDTSLDDDILEACIAKQRMGSAHDTAHFIYDGEIALIRQTELLPYDQRAGFFKKNT